LPRVVIVGCGFLGEVAADLLSKSGWEVLGICARPQSLPPLSSKSSEARALDITVPFAVEPAWRHVDALVHCAGPDQATTESYRLVYVQGLRNAVAAFAPRRVLFTSSTSVYAQTDGSWVNEASETRPHRETSRILLEAEDIALNAGGSVARLSGLYGPGRSVLMRKFLSGEAILEGDGTRWINQIHRDDAARALVQLVEGRANPGIYNVTDSTPATQLEVYSWLADHFHRPLPSYGPADLQRKRGWTNKRVCNRRLRKTDWQLTYPAYRDAIPTLIEN
jgi:nucleoside-diphosphate-sugar epimerase